MEEWRDIPGFEGRYQASDLGRVRSLDRILALFPINKVGHLGCALGRDNRRTVHSLVLLTFVGPCPAGQEGRHKNTICDDNRLSNLCYGTRSENHKDLTRAGRRRLTYAQIDEIRDKKKQGTRLVDLASEYGVGKSLISVICRNEIYVK